MKKIMAYFGHKLTGAPPEFKKDMDVLIGTVLKKMTDIERIKFLGLSWTDPGEVYDADIDQGVGKADIVFIILDIDSGGAVEEMCAALWLFGIPVVVIYKQGTKVSGLIRGTLKRYPHQTMEATYETAEDVELILIEAIAKFGLGTSGTARFQCLRSLQKQVGEHLNPAPTPMSVHTKESGWLS